jgi:hypothetical protein
MRLNGLIPVFVFASELVSAGSTTSMPVAWSDVALTPSAAPLQIQIPGSYAHWTLGVRVVPGCRESAKVADGFFPLLHGRFRSGAPAARPARVDAHGAALTVSSPAGLEIRPPAAGNSADVLLVYAEWAEARAVQVTVDGLTKFSGTVQSSVVVVDGSVAGTDLMDSLELVLYASAAGLPPPGRCRLGPVSSARGLPLRC